MVWFGLGLYHSGLLFLPVDLRAGWGIVVACVRLSVRLTGLSVGAVGSVGLLVGWSATDNLFTRLPRKYFSNLLNLAGTLFR